MYVAVVAESQAGLVSTRACYQYKVTGVGLVEAPSFLFAVLAQSSSCVPVSSSAILFQGLSIRIIEHKWVTRQHERVIPVRNHATCLGRELWFNLTLKKYQNANEESIPIMFPSMSMVNFLQDDSTALRLDRKSVV